MSNILMIFFSIITAVLGGFISYHLSLAYIGKTASLRSTFLPVIILVTIMISSRVFFNTSDLMQTFVVLLSLIFILRVNQKISWIFCVMAALLFMITNTFNSLFVNYPVKYVFGLKNSSLINNSVDCLIIGITELFIPSLTLFCFKYYKLSLIKLLSPNQVKDSKDLGND